ncbi:MAG: fluoride efflux transporter CrcB [Candidatus Latescibacteria bacterium]|nr:fluoride efflux transporter CrcB [Candidatus Latescibacterota bacterium]
MTRLLAIAAAGALGAVARYGLSGFAQRWFPPSFPGGTLVVNTLGCFLAGLLAALLLDRWPVGPTTRAALLIGFLGAFTTFSTFANETLALAREGGELRAALNVVLSVVLGLGAAWAGAALASLAGPGSSA